MTGRQVEVVHEIAVGIGIAKNPGARIYRQLKDKAALVALAAGVHANLHHALPDGATVAVAREMANGVEHSVLKSNFNRIFDIELVHGRMQFAALLDNCRKIFVQSGDDFADLYIGDHRSQTADQSFATLAPPAQGKITDRGQGLVHSIHRIADRIRELGLEQQKIRDSLRFQFRGARLAVSFKGSTTAQQADPIQIVGVLADDKISVQHDAEIARSLDIFA